MRNTSKKIRAVKQAQGKAGERLAAIPPYGYRKDPELAEMLMTKHLGRHNIDREKLIGKYPSYFL